MHILPCLLINVAKLWMSCYILILKFTVKVSYYHSTASTVIDYYVVTVLLVHTWVMKSKSVRSSQNSITTTGEIFWQRPVRYFPINCWMKTKATRITQGKPSPKCSGERERERNNKKWIYGEINLTGGLFISFQWQ